MPSYFSWFLSPLGLLVLATLDSTVAFFLPFANDSVIIYLAASHPELFWLYPLVAVAGGLLGGATTYWVGKRIGEQGIERWVGPRRLEAARRKAHATGAVALALPALIPPPFPFTPFMLASGALRVNPWRFFSVVAAGRFLRFMAEAILARMYGRKLLVWMESDLFRGVVWGFVALALAGSAWSIYMLVKKTRAERGARRPHPDPSAA